MSGRKIAIPLDEEVRPVSAGRPNMGLKELVKWWLSPFYYQEIDGKKFYFKKYRGDYYLLPDKKF